MRLQRDICRAPNTDSNTLHTSASPPRKSPLEPRPRRHDDAPPMRPGQRSSPESPAFKSHSIDSDKRPATPEWQQDVPSISRKGRRNSALDAERKQDQKRECELELEKKRAVDHQSGWEGGGERKISTPPSEPSRQSSTTPISFRSHGHSNQSDPGFPVGSSSLSSSGCLSLGSSQDGKDPSPGFCSLANSPPSTGTSERWTVASCHAQFTHYRETAHGVKKRADALVRSPGGLSGAKWYAAQLMWTDSLLLYAYGSWARDQHLRFSSAGGMSSARGAREKTSDQSVDAPIALPLENATTPRGVSDWSLLFPLLEHASHQLRKGPSSWGPVLDALLHTIRARITLLCASFSAGQISHRLSKLSSANRDAKSPEQHVLGKLGEQLSSALADIDRARNMENVARALLNPFALQSDFPCTWSALGTPSADLPTAAQNTLSLHPGSFAHITQSTNFHFERPGRPGPTGPLFPPPEGADALAHLIVLGRMMVAETARREELGYELASVLLPVA